MGQHADTRQSSPGETSATKDKALFSSTSRIHKLQDGVVALRAERPTEQKMCPTSCAYKMESARLVHACPPKISKSRISRGQFHKEPRGVEELVKYMSEVPAYLQLLESGSTNQEKALNMGVLEWGHLRKWTDRRRPLKTQHETNSPSFCSISSPCGSSGGRIIHGVRQIHSVQAPQGSSVGKGCDRQESQKKTSQQLANFLGSHTAPERRHQQHNNTWRLIKENAHGNDSASRAEKFTPSTSDGSTCSSQEVNTSLSTSTECEIPSSSDIKEGHCSRLRTNSVQVPPGDQFNGIFCAKDGIQDCLPRNDHRVEAQPIYSQDVPNGDPRFSLDSTVSENEVRASDGGYFSEVLSEYVSFKDLYSDIPHSCPLAACTEGSGWSDANIGASGNFVSASLNTCDLMGWLAVPKTSRFRCKLEKTVNFTSHPPKLIAATRKADSVPEDIVEAAVAKARETLHGQSRVSRSSSLKEIEVRRPTKGNAYLVDVYADKTTATSRDRQSPLRRMLDPLLKPRMSLRCPESVANSPASFVRRLSFSDKSCPKRETEVQDSSPNERASSSAGQGAGRLTISAWACESRSTLQDGKHERSKMQALLRLAWKNDLPLFTFSINDDDILVATRKKIFSDKQDVECAYTFYYVRENKRKSGWRNQGNKTKRQELVSKVVGRMNVSCAGVSESSGSISATHFSVREFVLFGAEIRPTTLETPNFLPESEIAAIVIKSLKDGADICSDSPHQSDHCSVSSSESKNMDISVSSNIVAILPSEVHGLSESGSPSPLIERWKTGGFCDCGGWDVGCSVSVLTGKLEQSCTSTTAGQSGFAAVSTHRTELIVQGKSKKNSPIFSLVPFNEGLFTVDFDESISVLQAFSICTAILHRRKPSTNAKLHNPLQQQTFPGDILPLKDAKGSRGKAPAAYATYHPPLSPVGRAQALGLIEHCISASFRHLSSVP